MAVTGGTWRDETVAGHTLEIYTPPQPSEHGFVVIYLHGQGLGSLREQPAFTRQFDRHGLRVVCPRTGPTWWADKIVPRFDARRSPERYVVEDVAGWIRETWTSEPPRWALLGTSMGGQGALRIAFKRPNLFPTVAAIAPAIDFQQLVNEGDEVLYELYGDPESARQDTALLHVHPLNWPRNTWFCSDPADAQWHEGADRLRMKMQALGIPFEHDLQTEAGGHTWQYYNHMAEPAIAFIAKRLESERLRV